MRARTVVLIGAGAAAAVTVSRLARAADPSPIAQLADGERVEVDTTDGARLVVDVAGPSDGPTVVLAHCWGGDIANWAPVAAPLVESGHRVIRWYQRGHGPSTVGSTGSSAVACCTGKRRFSAASSWRACLAAIMSCREVSR